MVDGQGIATRLRWTIAFQIPQKLSSRRSFPTFRETWRRDRENPARNHLLCNWTHANDISLMLKTITLFLSSIAIFSRIPLQNTGSLVLATRMALLVSFRKAVLDSSFGGLRRCCLRQMAARFPMRPLQLSSLARTFGAIGCQPQLRACLDSKASEGSPPTPAISPLPLLQPSCPLSF